jgi:hypothetical protein
MVVALALAGAGPATGQQDDKEDGAARAALERFTSPTLTRFAGEEEFEAYVEALRAHPDFASAPRPRRVQFAQAETQPDVQDDAPAEEPLCPPDRPCDDPFERGEVYVTGSTITPTNPSITNNQMRNVDEGDIVKQIGRHLLVLSDGRIFVVDTRPNGRRGLSLADRIDVYRDPESDTWYDEMLVFGDRVLITGYSYDDEATELAVFRLSPEGRLAREGLFHISSNDYYDSDNYATRLVGDRLVIYTPIALAEGYGARFRYPIVRRWVAGESRDAAERRGRRLFDARSIYRPVRTETNPTIHTVSVCPLGEATDGRELECRTTAFAGPPSAEWYVTEQEAFLWATGESWSERDECAAGAPVPLGSVVPATLFRVPHSQDAAPQVAAARGVPFDQFSLQSNDGRLRALVDRRPGLCERDYSRPVEPIYFDMPLEAFRPTVAEIPHDRYTAVPSPGTRWIANRFTERHLVYGGLSRYRQGPPEDSSAMPPAYAVPADRPRAARRLDVGHSVIRAERAGNNIVLTGYRNRRGLSVSMIDLRRTPRVASTLELDGRFESEGRSHAFNSRIEPSGSGVMGLPTSPKRSDSDRWWWRSYASDVSFFAADREGALVDLGMLGSSVVYDRREEEDGLANYHCEVSCIDWYGNSRPIFTDGRVFALSGIELIEGRLLDDRIFEVRRFDYARARPQVAAR